MKISYCSDLHIEFDGVELPGGDVLILAGDVCELRTLKKDFHSTRMIPHVPGSREHRYYDFFYHECSKYEEVFYVMGNHEHYGGRFDQTLENLRAVMPDNVTILEKECVEYRGVVFCGATLWTNANNMDSLTLYHLKYNMNDYRHIKTHNQHADIYHKLLPENTVADHVKAMSYFTQELPKHADKPVVMISHHAPSFMSISEQYKGDFHMNGGYGSDLSEFLLDHPQIKAHIHGHVHSTHSYDIGGTRVLCRPRGYKGHERIAENFEVGSFEIDDLGNFIF